MTPLQKQVLLFIDHFTWSNGYAPTYEEIGKGLGTSASSAHRMSVALKDNGYIMWPERKANRKMAITHKGARYINALEKVGDE